MWRGFQRVLGAPQAQGGMIVAIALPPLTSSRNAYWVLGTTGLDLKFSSVNRVDYGFLNPARIPETSASEAERKPPEQNTMWQRKLQWLGEENQQDWITDMPWALILLCFPATRRAAIVEKCFYKDFSPPSISKNTIQKETNLYFLSMLYFGHIFVSWSHYFVCFYPFIVPTRK